MFEECYKLFCCILENKLGITLASGQASHVLRHTFASHFMMNGGNIFQRSVATLSPLGKFRAKKRAAKSGSN
ncbi:hypothetical protein BJD94_16030 [Vibrio vulnificus Env1]|nr:hypothetical protein BJD94_16030 [Vibrio vulnificus Env1]